MCKVPQCQDKHKKHYCRICQDEDSDHFARQCYKTGIVVYHGSKVQFQGLIMTNGLQPSKNGRLGPGIYFTTKNHAIKIAKYRNGNGKAVIFQMLVNQDKCSKGIHPPWAGINTSFPQWCLNSNNFQVLKAYKYEGDYIQQQLDLKREYKGDKYHIIRKVTKIHQINPDYRIFCEDGHYLRRKEGKVDYKWACVCEGCKKAQDKINVWFYCLQCQYALCQNCKNDRIEADCHTNSFLCCPLSHRLKDGNSGFCKKQRTCSVCLINVEGKNYYYCDYCNYFQCYYCSSRDIVIPKIYPNPHSWLKCPNNHLVFDEKINKSHRKCICDICQQKPLGSRFFYCKPCDYDICYPCAAQTQKSTLPAIERKKGIQIEKFMAYDNRCPYFFRMETTYEQK